MWLLLLQGRSDSDCSSDDSTVQKRYGAKGRHLAVDDEDSLQQVDGDRKLILSHLLHKKKSLLGVRTLIALHSVEGQRGTANAQYRLRLFLTALLCVLEQGLLGFKKKAYKKKSKYEVSCQICDNLREFTLSD